MNDETEPQAQPALRRDDEPALLVALFRYGVLGPLLEREDLGAGEVTALVAAAAGATHYLPGRGLVRVSQRTVYAWFKACGRRGRPKRAVAQEAENRGEVTAGGFSAVLLPGRDGADVDAQGLGHLPLWEAAVEADSAQVLAHRFADRRGSRNGVPILGG